jgi:muconolactone D-isomerase
MIMLFLFKGESTGTVPIPPDQFMEIAVNQVEALNRLKKQGKILAGGVMVGRKGSYAIWDVDSTEELQSILTQLPMFPFTEAEIVPLLDYDQAAESAKRALAAIKEVRRA